MPRRIQLAAGQRRTGPLVATPSPESFTLEAQAAPAKPAKAKARKVPASGVRRKPAAKRQGGRKAVR